MVRAVNAYGVLPTVFVAVVTVSYTSDAATRVSRNLKPAPTVIAVETKAPDPFKRCVPPLTVISVPIAGFGLGHQRRDVTQFVVSRVESAWLALLPGDDG